MTLEAHLRDIRDQGRKLLVPYVTGGITDRWTDHLLAFQDAGADAIEVGLPFSDPMLDGATIQEASDRALARGTSTTKILADLAAVSGRITVPIVAMTYANLVIRRGADAFCTALRDADVSGLIVPDFPLNEVAPLERVAAATGIELVLLAAPSTAPGRLREICDRSRGFVYAISVMGTTGERTQVAESAQTLAGSLKELADRPVLIGFGVSTPAHAVRAAGWADGVVVASALMRRVLDGAAPARVGADLAEMRSALDDCYRAAHA